MPEFFGTLIAANDLEDLPGLATTEEQRTYAARRASSLVVSRWADPISPPPEWVRDIAIDVAVRYLTNPRGITSVTRTVDDASRTERYEGPRREGGFNLTDDEIARLNPTVRRRRVGSIRLAVPDRRRS